MSLLQGHLVRAGGGGGGGQGGPRLLSQLPENISGERVNTKQSPSKS